MNDKLVKAAYVGGLSLLALTYAYTLYHKHKTGKDFKPNKFYYLGLSLIAFTYLSHVHKHGKEEKWW